MVWAQAVDAVEVLRYNGRASGKGGGQVLRQLKYFQSVVRLCSFSQAIEENYLSQSAISQHPHALVTNDELYAVQAASTEPLEEATPAGLVLFHALGCLCGNFILPEPASYVFFYAFSNLHNLLYMIRTKYPTKLA